MARLQLRELCGYRAGDKGDIANVAIFADDDETYALICREATAARVKEHFGAMVLGRVDRYEAANVRALNFVMQGALGGGGGRGGTELLGIWPTLVDKPPVDAHVRVTIEEVV